MGIAIDAIDKVVKGILDEYVEDVNATTADVIENVAKECVKELKNTSPKDKGRYAKTWTYDKNIKRAVGKYGTTVYNKTNYRLTHLLEYGHDLVSKTGKLYGRTKAIPHIKPAEEKAVKDFEKKLKEQL